MSADDRPTCPYCGRPRDAAPPWCDSAPHCNDACAAVTRPVDVLACGNDAPPLAECRVTPPAAAERRTFGFGGVLAVALALAWAGAAHAADPPPSAKLTGPRTADVGHSIILNPTGTVAPDGLDFALAEGPDAAPVVTLKSDDGQTVIGLATAAKPGVYRFVVTAWGKAEAGKRPPHAFAFWTVTVGGPGPNPDPNPNPVDPPSDPLWITFKAAFPGTAGDKADAANIGNVYRAASTTTVNDPRLTKLGEVRDAVATVLKGVAPLPKLQTCRQILADDLAKTFGTEPSTPLDAALRQKLAVQFARYAALWEAVAK